MITLGRGKPRHIMVEVKRLDFVALALMMVDRTRMDIPKRGIKWQFPEFV